MGFDIGSVLSVIDLPGTLIGGACQALGMSPATSNVIKTGLGVMSGDLLMAADGAVNLGKNIQCAAQTSYFSPVGCAPPCGYAPTCMVPPPPLGCASPMGGYGYGMGMRGFEQQELWSVNTLANHFPQAERGGYGLGFPDGRITMSDLRSLSSSPWAPPDLRQASQFFVNNPGAWMQVARSPSLSGQPSATPMDLQRASMGLTSQLYGPGCCGPVLVGPPAPGGYPVGPAPMMPPVGINPLGSPYPPTGLPPMGMGFGGMGMSPLGSIMNMPGMSMEARIMAILQQVENQQDQQLMNTASQLQQSGQQSGGYSTTSDQQMLNLQLQNLMEARKNTFDTMSDIQQKFSDMSSLAIQNMGR
jgi:hypothetical protein